MLHQCMYRQLGIYFTTSRAATPTPGPAEWSEERQMMNAAVRKTFLQLV